MSFQIQNIILILIIKQRVLKQNIFLSLRIIIYHVRLYIIHFQNQIKNESNFPKHPSSKINRLQVKKEQKQEKIESLVFTPQNANFLEIDIIFQQQCVFHSLKIEINSK
ncbi:unnamed protein product [Paramecium primaurelia]|uniref:Uncharacterized protein n=1 Tax=Paramecium primaurelia TaxID=5886 RepID=A0A8S1KXA3_PARPR|nr:unnamed protein product [Paramecium primaurelia]